MDYKELIKQLRNALSEDGYGLEHFVCEIDAAATAIETLLRERDAAVDELRGRCWVCAHGKPFEQAGPLSKLTGCEHLSEFGVLARGGGKCKCPHCQWRGPQKAVSDSDTK